MVSSKPPLQASSTHSAAASASGGKIIEERYRKMDNRTHILQRPDMYIGSLQKRTEKIWVFDVPASDVGVSSGAMVHRTVTYSRALYRIFDEILVNASDNRQRDQRMDTLRVEINVDQCLISVFNNGEGIPVTLHNTEKIFVPEMILGQIRTSENFDEHATNVTGGRNGYGAKLTNIFSTEFHVETADGHKLYSQVFSNNMEEKTEPKISDCNEGENWTKITFKPDLARFSMNSLDKDIVAVMSRRVIDLAAVLGESVNVELNGKRVPVKSFLDYVTLYANAAAQKNSNDLPIIHEKVNDRWEVCVSPSEGQFQQVSFVNGVATLRGGTHVDYIVNQITNHMMAVVKRKIKSSEVQQHNLKKHLWVFINVFVDNPEFDTQTKERLETVTHNFGSECVLSNDFLKRVEKCGVISKVLSWVDLKRTKALKKTDGKKRPRVIGIDKLEDANCAGGKDSDKCTLILTEGDSAKALAMAGSAGLGRDFYGVFPLKGKPLNVREATNQQIIENVELNHVKKILGLEHGKQYNSTKSLRYGHVMIMADQDHDGTHIKGLLINFFHFFWPSLIKFPLFLSDLITPIIKAKNRRSADVICFYSMPEYEAWKQNEETHANRWSIKYYKGLGTSKSTEGIDYFKDIDRRQRNFVWEDDEDDKAIELAFSKRKNSDGKDWLSKYLVGTSLDPNQKNIRYRDFIHKELLLFSLADLRRSIPSMVDGLKPGQRKILYCAFKRKLDEAIKVSEFVGYASEHSAYHHGEQSLASTVVGMAQNYVGSNNINLFNPEGQFGTRVQGGKDAASDRYIYTKLSPVTRSLFPKDDDILLEYEIEDGMSVEPSWYMPVLPMVLVNGCRGIGTGWSTFVPSYDPRDIISNLKKLLNNEEMKPMCPFYRGFKGQIIQTANASGDSTYISEGVIKAVDSNLPPGNQGFIKVKITELPVHCWTDDYRKKLDKLLPGNKGFIKDYTVQGDHDNYEVILTEENMSKAVEGGLEKTFKLTSKISTTNMHLLDSAGKIKKYNTPEQILEEFYKLRRHYYAKRKETLLANLELKLKKLRNEITFIKAVVHGEIKIFGRRRLDLLEELKKKNYDTYQEEKKKSELANEDDDTEENSEAVHSITSGYEYLISMAADNFTIDKMDELMVQKVKLESQVTELRQMTVKSMWLKDLDSVEKMLDKMDVEAATERREALEKVSKLKIGAMKSVLTEAEENNNEIIKGLSKRGGPKKSSISFVILSDDDETDMAA